MIDKSLILWLEVFGLCLVGLLVLGSVYLFCQVRKNARKEALSSKDTEEMLEAMQSSKYRRSETDKELISQREPQLDDKENQIF